MHRPATASCRERGVHVPSWGQAFAPSAQEGLGIPRKAPVTGALAEGRGQRAPPVLFAAGGAKVLPHNWHLN